MNNLAAVGTAVDIVAVRRRALDTTAVVVHCHKENFFVQPSVVDSSTVVRIHHCGM